MITLKKYWIGIVLCFIFLFAGVIRFYELSSMPVSLYWDEVSIGYNAYSIEQTGKDEYGMSYPVLFKAYNDYKASGYIYLTAFAVALFGLNEFAVRFSSAFSGTLTVLLVYFLVVQILGLLKKENKTKSSLVQEMYKNRNIIGLITSFLLAISPWHIQFSRVGFEANVALFLVVLGSVFLIKNIEKISPSILISALCFSLSFYFYRSTYVFTPLLLLGTVVIFKAELLQQIKNKHLWIAILIFLGAVVPFLPLMLSSQGMVRTNQTSIFSSSYEELSQAAITRQKLGDPKWAQIIYNRRVIYGEKIISSYLSHFTPKFLFIEGDSNARHRTIGFGEMYLWEAPFLLLGIFVLFKLPKKIRYFIILWILIAPLPASISIPTPHALRTLNMLPMPQLLVSLGILFMFLKITVRVRFISAVVLGLIIVAVFSQYVASYNYTVNYIGKDWGDGYKQLTQYVFKNEYKYDKIVISGHYWQPYMYFLFYKKYDPFLYQTEGNNKHFGKYLFGGTSWDHGVEFDPMNLAEFAGTKNTLVALSPREFESEKKQIKKLVEIHDHAGEVVFVVGKLQ